MWQRTAKEYFHLDSSVVSEAFCACATEEGKDLLLEYLALASTDLRTLSEKRLSAKQQDAGMLYTFILHTCNTFIGLSATDLHLLSHISAIWVPGTLTGNADPEVWTSFAAFLKNMMMNEAGLRSLARYLYCKLH